MPCCSGSSEGKICIDGPLFVITAPQEKGQFSWPNEVMVAPAAKLAPPPATLFKVISESRTRTLTAIQGRRLIAEFAAISAASLVMLTPSANDFELALEYVSHFATHLRGPDALHLAIARNNGAQFIATLDAGMLAAAKRLKIPARRVVR